MLKRYNVYYTAAKKYEEDELYTIRLAATSLLNACVLALESLSSKGYININLIVAEEIGELKEFEHKEWKRFLREVGLSPLPSEEILGM